MSGRRHKLARSIVRDMVRAGETDPKEARKLAKLIGRNMSPRAMRLNFATVTVEGETE